MKSNNEKQQLWNYVVNKDPVIRRNLSRKFDSEKIKHQAHIRCASFMSALSRYLSKAYPSSREDKNDELLFCDILTEDNAHEAVKALKMFFRENPYSYEQNKYDTGDVKESQKVYYTNPQVILKATDMKCLILVTAPERYSPHRLNGSIQMGDSLVVRKKSISKRFTDTTILTNPGVCYWTPCGREECMEALKRDLDMNRMYHPW